MVPTTPSCALTEPVFSGRAEELSLHVSEMQTSDIMSSMHISEKLAEGVSELYKTRSSLPLSATCEVFRGDIFSGLRALEWSNTEKDFAQNHLCFLSGLYGILRPYDAIQPYRLEAAYKLPKVPNIYTFWGDSIAKTLPEEGSIVNLTSAEYSKLIFPYIDTSRCITPKFLTVKPGQTTPSFVAVHAKIARGAYARWLVYRGQDSTDNLEAFNDLGYAYSATLSTSHEPVYICTDFKGIGLSQRLK